jgi:short-subunit dehydrogenase
MNKPTALITGTSTGIGVSLAHLYAKNGYNLILMARRQELLKTLSDSIQKENHGIKILCVESDVTQYEKHIQDIRSACAQFETLDIAIANAGVGGVTNEWENTWARSYQILTTNVLGAVATLETCKDIMLKQGFGKLVGVTSVAATRGLPQSSAYCASKAALEKFLESMRTDVHAKGIEVIAIHPGFISTPMTAKNGKMPFLMGPDKAAEKIYNAIEKNKVRFYFPWQMAVSCTLMRLLPHSFFDGLMRMTQKRVSVFRKKHG